MNFKFNLLRLNYVTKHIAINIQAFSYATQLFAVETIYQEDKKLYYSLIRDIYVIYSITFL